MSLRPNHAELFRWVADRTRPGDFFLAAAYPAIFFPLALRNPAEVSFFTNTDYTRPEQVRNTLVALEKHRVKFILWPPYISYGGDYRPEGDHLAPLRAYLHTHYHPVKAFNGCCQI